MPELRDIRKLIKDEKTGEFLYEKLPTTEDYTDFKEITNVDTGSLGTIISGTIPTGSVLRVTRARYFVEGGGGKGKFYLKHDTGTIDIIFFESEGVEYHSGNEKAPVYVIPEGTFELVVLSYGTAFTYGGGLAGYYSKF